VASLKSELKKRTITALFLIPAVLLIIYLGNICFTILVIIAFGLSEWEFLNMFNVKVPLRIYSILLLVVPILLYFFNLKYFIFLSPLLIFLPIPILWNRGISIREFALSTFILIYMLIGAISVLLLRTHLGVRGILFFLFIIWIFDSLAYISGSLWGKHKLAEKISPKKTIEGYIYGILLTIPFAYLLFLLKITPPSAELLVTLILTVILSALSQVGDLVESTFKREVGVKDSSNIFPGHGGMLDRIDSIVFTAPYFALITRLFGLWK